MRNSSKIILSTLIIITGIGIPVSYHTYKYNKKIRK